jgi:predicted metal-dependent phosphoesterase TrpH
VNRVRVDCHLHTVASGDAVTTLEQLAERARQTGLDVVGITDHNETSAAVAATERDLGLRVIVGEEIRTPDGDVIGLFLAERIPYVLPAAEAVRRIRAQGGASSRARCVSAGLATSRSPPRSWPGAAAPLAPRDSPP